MRILFVSPEVSPFIKEGGLADVVGALPIALAGAGHDVRVICPRHGGLRTSGEWRRMNRILFVPTGGGMHYAGLWETALHSQRTVPVYFIEYDEYFARGEIYHGPWGAHADNDRRFAFFARAAFEACHSIRWIPDVLHCHDWTTGLVPVLLNEVFTANEWAKTASVFTIHNMQHQGHFAAEVLDFAGLPRQVFRSDALESFGGLNWMKGAIYHADKVTTVSPTYAREIRSPEGGFGLDRVLNFKGADLIGILNGIDTESWNPASDPALPTPFSAADLSGKAEGKTALQKAFGLDERPEIPVFGVVSRLFHQKGLDLLLSIIERLADSGRMHLVVLGSGEKWEEDSFRKAADRHPRLVGVRIGFDENLAHLIIGASDFFVMPSRFEPCGLGQQYAMRYGTIPIVRRTGGLADTVVPMGTEGATGFVFDDAQPFQLLEKIMEAVSLWEIAPDEIERLRMRGMRRDASWANAACEYQDVYRWAVASRTGG